MPRRPIWESWRRTICEGPVRSSAGRPAETSNRYSFLLGHASIQTTERYLGTEQALAHAVNDAIGLDMS